MNGRIESMLAGIIIGIAITGLCLSVLTLPVVTRTLVISVGSAEQAGLTESVAIKTAEHVRAYVMADDVPELPSRVEGRTGFTPDAVAHLDDVRSVLSGSTWATLAALVLTAAWVAANMRSGRLRPVVRGLRAGALLIVSAVPLFALIAALDFDSFFAGFHALFFESGTWQFPQGDLLIQLFPQQFWVWEGVLWGALLAVGAVGLWVAARAIERVQVGRSA